MSRNYDNWERLVAAVLKRDQIWQLCHQDSISICSESSSLRSDLELSLPVSLGSFGIADTFEFGTSNLAMLSQHVQEYFCRGTKSVIKLLDAVNVTEREFEEQMILLGNLRHENVGIPWAYYFSQTTKLVVYDCYSKGSVFDMLHGDGRRPNWESRVRIAVGAARGIAHIHAQCGGKLFHGNIQSSNIFVNRQQYGCVSADFALAGNPQSHDESQERDVYCFGLVLLELVTRIRSPPLYIVDHLRSFEPSIIDSKYCLEPERYVDEVEIFEKNYKFPFVAWELMNDASEVNEELVWTLLVAKRCLAVLTEDRPTMFDVVAMLDTIRYKQGVSRDSAEDEKARRRYFLLTHLARHYIHDSEDHSASTNHSSGVVHKVSHGIRKNILRRAGLYIFSRQSIGGT